MSVRKLSLNYRLRIASVAVFATLVLGSLNAFSQSDSPLADDHPNEYVVQVGDTLWDIAARFLKDPWYWPEIWYINPEIVNPHLIYPGDVLGLVYVEGRQMVTPIRASSYRLSPEARITPLTEAITSVSYESIAAFLATGAVLSRDDVDQLPYLVATRGDHLVAAAGNTVYVRRNTDDTPGQRFNIVHVGDELVDPDNNRVVGFQGIMVGSGTLRRGGDPATLAITESSMEAKQGDVLIPAAVELPLNFYPKAPSGNVDGRIISVVGGVSQIGQYMVVVLNRGSGHGLAVGDVLTVFQDGPEVVDHVEGGTVTLPDEAAGTLMVFKTFDNISYGLIMEATTAIHKFDHVRNPI
ncbi:MAG: LysM peptidoglycan-binding domain-containing protein [Gammaproteobacteria bacterium]|nr:LysM peptidoglycan-binding domain-containing protein [Gammaproteobacteria bacterium]MDH5304478.1 LysM peptidoglycan-binding domain-containing protein [Gammaproteobacteria bacterium]MDH5321979.1 LysM peptidoglycan-binding domain-containing protein [Gammaproteobacteria bacterium]